jgi:hypothetical protein
LAGTGSLATINQLNSLSGYVNSQDVATGNAVISYANGIGTNLSGNLQVSGSTLNNRINSLSGFVIGASGGLETRIAATGNSAVNYANSIGINLSGNLQLSGSYLYTTLTGASGALNTRIESTGSQAWNAANNNGTNISGNMAATGAALIARDLAISGVLQAQINESNADVSSINGQSGALIIAGTGGLTVLSGAVGLILVSGDTSISGALTQSGVALGAKIDSLSGFINNVSGGLETRIFQSGAASVAHANSIGQTLSGNLTLTGQTLFARDAAISGGLEARITASGNATVSHANGIGVNLSGNLTITGQTLQARITSLSGFVVAASGGLETRVFATGAASISYTNLVSGGLEARIAQTGQAAWISANGAANTISGNLTTTGQTLQNRLTSLSGVMESTFVHRTGNEMISGSKQFLNGLGTSGINFNGTSGSGIFLQVETQGGVSYYGTGASGSLLSIEDNSVGSIFAVTDVYEAPILEVFDDGRIVGGSFNSNALFVSGAGVAFGANYVPTGYAVFISGNTQYIGHIYSGTTNISDIFYPRNNPSGYITGLAGTGNLVSITTFNAFSGYVNSQDAATGSAAVNHSNGMGSIISGNLTQTGATLNSRISSLSGFVISASGGLEARIVATGNAAISYANGIGTIVSGNLTTTGQTLFNRDVSISGGLEARITATGNAAISHANSVGSNLSGNLTITGQTLNDKINALSGYAAPGQAAYFYRTGNQVVTGNATVLGNFTIISGQYEPQKTIASNYSVLSTDARLYCDNSAPISLTFGSAVTNSGQMLKIKLINTGSVYFTGTFGQFFDGAASYVAAGQYNAYEVHANGANWYLW